MTSYSPDKVSSIKDLAIVDRRHSAVAVQDEPTLIDAVSTYNLAFSQQRSALYEDLSVVVASVFRRIPRNRVHLLDEEDYLLNAIYLLREERNVVSLYVYREEIQKHLNKLPAILDEIIAYSQGGKRMHQELLMTWTLRSYIRKLKTLLNRPVTKTNLNEVARESDGLVLALSAGFSDLGLDASNPIAKRKENDQKQKLAQQKTEEQQERIVLQDWLCNISPDLLVAYRDTEDIFAEAKTLPSSPEDEYFLEQVNADYYPHIFEALGKFEGENSDFDAKELVVVEALKQFGIIQLGLQKIIDNAVEQNLASIKSQTDFLRNKVLGERSFSLTPKEAEVEIENSVEESQRIREELYKKHVAPVLEKNREEYESKIADLKSEHQQEIYLQNETLKHLKREHQEEIVQLDRLHASEICTYMNRVAKLEEKHRTYVRDAESYRLHEQKKLQQKNESEISLLQKYYESLQSSKATDFTVKALNEEIRALQTSLFAMQENNMGTRKLTPEQQVALSRKRQLDYPDYNMAKAELYESPSYYRKASKAEIHDIYADDIYDDDLFDEEGY